MADLQCLIIMSTDTTVGIAGISWVKRIPMLADLLRQTSLTQFAQLEKTSNFLHLLLAMQCFIMWNLTALDGCTK